MENSESSSPAIAPTVGDARADCPNAQFPEWLTEINTSPEPEPSGPRPNRYVARSIADLAGRCAKALESETWPSANGLMQGVDARAKLIGIIPLVGVCSLSHHLVTLISIYLAVLAAAGASYLPIAPFVTRVWLAVPVFVGGATLPVMLNTFSPGHELCTIWRHPHLAITSQGVLLALILVARVGVGVSLGALLALTTHWSQLMSALRSFGVPRLFVNMLAMTYRYAILLMSNAAEMFLARTSRTVGRTSNNQGRRFMGTGIGSLFEKTLALSEEVHNAMISRGFTGDIRTYYKPAWRWSDTLWLSVTLLLSASAFVCDRWIGASV